MSGTLSYRGFMLDSSRHYMPVASIKAIIRAASVSGMNRMHWLLTDDQGWRLEIRRYPRLTEIGAKRGPTCLGAEREWENNEGFYSQEEVRDIVSFARDAGIEIVPEIEVPGHASAMLAAYPEFGCRREMTEKGKTVILQEPYTYRTGTMAGVFPNLICAGKDEAVDFLKGILDEVVDLFPGPEVHIGGDEAIKQHWRRCPDCQKRMRALGLRDENELQRWLVMEIGEHLRRHGKKTIVWNESLDGGPLPENFIVQHWWGNDAETEAFMELGGQVICSDTETYYISRPYGAIDLKKIYSTPLVPSYARKHPENLTGLECPMWSERVTNPERAAFLLFPRIPAVARKALGKEESWDKFLQGVKTVQSQVESMGIHGAPESYWVISPEDAAAEKAAMEASRSEEKMADTWRVADAGMIQERLEKLLEAIQMPRLFALRVMDFAWKAVPEYCGQFPTDEGDGADIMALQLKQALRSREKGAWAGIPESVWLATMACMTRFVKEHERSTGRYAFDRSWWTVRQTEARLFRLGELEYELAEGEEGTPYLALHIPSDADLTAEKLNRSVQEARSFMKQYFPAYADAEIRCTSWLLSPALREMLPENSRILHFQAAFDPDDSDTESDSAVEWVYQLTGEQASRADVQQLPEKTTLQRKLKEKMLRGGHAGTGSGHLARPFA